MMQRKYIMLLLGGILPFVVLQAQLLEAESKLSLLLSDSTQVELYKAHQAVGYYYLPTNFRLSKVNDKPEFSFLAYDEDSDGKNDGAIMHLLLKWGLNKAQEKEAQMLLEETHDRNAAIWGAAQVELPEGQAWRIYHGKDSSITKFLQATIYTKASTPSHANGKWAASFRFDAAGATSMEETLKDEAQLKQIFVEWHYTFQIAIREGYATRSVSQPLVLKKSMYELIGEIVQ